MSLRDRLFINAHQAGPDALRLAASLGVSGVRIDANWPDLELSPNQWTWEWLDTLLATCRTLNLQVYCTLSQTPAWIASNRGDLPPLHDWIKFCSAFAKHFKGRLMLVGCWNEFNGSPDDYVRRLLRPMEHAFHAVDPSYRICGPDLQTEGQWPAWLRAMLQQSQDCLNILTVHCYAKDGQAVWKALTEPRPRWVPRWSPWPRPSIREVIEQAGWVGPTWLTETGFSDEAGEDVQARAVDQLLERLQGASWPDGLCYFQLIDDDNSHQGLFRRDGSMKPAGAVLQSYAGKSII
jgi:hypothetical protein